MQDDNFVVWRNIRIDVAHLALAFPEGFCGATLVRVNAQSLEKAALSEAKIERSRSGATLLSRRPHQSYSVRKTEFSIPDLLGSPNPFDLMNGRETC